MTITVLGVNRSDKAIQCVDVYSFYNDTVVWAGLCQPIDATLDTKVEPAER